MPDTWKTSITIPVYKAESKENIKNYRPISLLPLLSKLLEKAICKLIVDFLETNKILYKFFSGFRKQHSTEAALLKITDDILKNMDDKLIKLLLLMDFSKAFDTIDHALLLTKLVRYNFDAHSVFWLSSYLQNRTQLVKIESELSSPCHISCGVPQGSVLGPILFIIYLNDLPFILQDVSTPSVFATKIHCYADDTRLYNSATVSHLPAALDKVVEDASIIMDWFTQNKLKVNPEKFKFMLIGSPKLLCEMPEELKSINIRGQESKCAT